MSVALLASLNRQQRQAVELVDHPLLIVAGVGSGKTRVITHKMAYLVLERGFRPAEVLGVTFTNRAADEMKRRVEQLTGEPPGAFPVFTFHALGLRLLRESGHILGFDNSWTVVDDSDQRKIIDTLIRDLDVDINRETRDVARGKINRAKMRLRYPNDPSALETEGFSATEQKIFTRYHSFQTRHRVWDYEDLVSFAVRLLQHDPEIRALFQRRFRYILVDEFQDTNPNQYELVKQLAGGQNRITVVGDDDQAVYSWRGADIRYLFDFEKDFPGTRVVTLEQNYRSTQPILDFANALISRNRRRRKKTMWTRNQTGLPVVALHSRSREEEAEIVARYIAWALKREVNLFPMAVLYRINSQSLPFENEFLQRGIPFRIVKGMRFFERKEIKDAVALLRLALDPEDDYAFRRVADSLPLGIGPKTISRLEDDNGNHGLSLFDAYKRLYPDRWRRIPLFKAIEEDLRRKENGKKLSTVLEILLNQSGYLERLGEKRNHDRAMNVEELISFIRGWEEENPDGDFHQLLDKMSLHAGGARMGRDAQVFLLTMHNAKGTEFKSVVVAGLNDAYMPFFLREGPDEYEEERRLFYVAVTRAIERLIVSVGGARQSPFLRDIERRLLAPAFGLEDLVDGTEIKKRRADTTSSAGAVNHPLFGKGRIIRDLGGRRFLIHFNEKGQKIIDASLVDMIFE